MSTALIRPEAVLGDTLEDLGTELFATLRRSDQRRRGMEYIHGLLSTRGRKSIRNMAALKGSSTARVCTTSSAAPPGTGSRCAGRWPGT